MASDQDRPEELFARFLVQARRSLMCLWFFRALCRGLLWPTPAFILLMWFRRPLQTDLLPLATGYCVTALAIMIVYLWSARKMVTRVAETLDGWFSADGRIVAADEFLAGAEQDSFKRLAIGEVTHWLTDNYDGRRLRRWPREVYLLVVIVMLVYLAYRFV